MKSKRGFHQSRPLLAATMLLAGAALACKLGGNSEQESGQNAPVDPNAPSNQVTRYAGAEAADTGQSTIRQAVAARTSADWSSTMVATIYSGTVVTRTARYGNFTLIRWSGIAGLQQQGWVDSSVAFTTTPPRLIPTNPGIDPGVQGGFVATPTPTVNTPPPPTVAQPTPPPPTVATTPPPPKTVTPPPPPPPPPPKTATPPPPATGKSFKPPKLH